MKYRPFGATGLSVSEIGFGGSRIGGLMARGNSDTSTATLHAAFEAGINFYDTADMYSQGESESLIGQAFRDRRDRVIIASKGGYLLPTRRHILARVKPLIRPLVRCLGIKRENLPAGVSGKLAQDFSPAYLTRALEASLRRLHTDYIDIYQLHSPSQADIASESFLETLHVLQGFQQAGKIRHYGVAGDWLDDGDSAARRGTLDSLEVPYGLLDPDPNGLLPVWRDQGIGVIARGSFGGGLLKESLTESQLRQQTPKCDWILALRRLAAQWSRPMMELALQYCLRTPGIAVTLLGMRTVEHVRDNIRSYNAPPMTDEEFVACAEMPRNYPQASLH